MTQLSVLLVMDGLEKMCHTAIVAYTDQYESKNTRGMQCIVGMSVISCPDLGQGAA